MIAQGSARIQHGVRKPRELTGNNGQIVEQFGRAVPRRALASLSERPMGRYRLTCQNADGTTT
jgi:hypothetical protein